MDSGIIAMMITVTGTSARHGEIGMNDMPGGKGIEGMAIVMTAGGKVAAIGNMVNTIKAVNRS